MNEIRLAGCTPTPLANYLKAMGIFRLVAEQKDPGVRACWRGERFALITRLSREELVRFFLEEYRPTPILSPWNGRAGYLEGDNPEESTRRGAALLRIFRASKALRLFPYREMIQDLDRVAPIQEMNSVRAAKKVLEKEKKLDQNGWTEEKQSELNSTAKRESFLKEQLLNLLRNALQDGQLAWLDAAVAIGSEKAFAPLLGGSGGVEGSMDLGVNFMDNLLLLFAPELESGAPTADSGVWLNHAILGQPVRLVAKNTAGSLSPERVGGPNATTGFVRYFNINPWEYVLMIEGAVTYKPSLTRKWGSTGRVRMSYPFTVEPSSIGSGSISPDDNNKTRAGASEVWMPLWSQPAQYVEIVALLREGSVRLGTKTPRDGLDMARCIARLGVDRGINGFQRFLFLKRCGDNDLAVPLSRFDLSQGLSVDADLINDLERGQFLDLLRRAGRDRDTSASLRRTVSQLENTLFALTRPGAGKPGIQRALILLGEAMQALAVSRKGQEAVPVLPSLSAAWVLAANDDTAEFRLALALASLPHMSAHVAPVEWSRSTRRWEWQPENRLHVWGKGGLTRNLVRVAERRLVEAQRTDAATEPLGSPVALGARRSDLFAFLSKGTDDTRIVSLLQGMVWVRLPDALAASPHGTEAATNGALAPMPVAYGVLKPFFASASLLRDLRRLPEDARWVLPQEIPRLLTAGKVQEALAIAWRRSRIAGLGWPVGACPKTAEADGPRLLAALAVPLQTAELARLLPRVEDQEPETVQL